MVYISFVNFLSKLVVVAVACVYCEIWILIICFWHRITIEKLSVQMHHVTFIYVCVNFDDDDICLILFTRSNEGPLFWC